MLKLSSVEVTDSTNLYFSSIIFFDISLIRCSMGVAVWGRAFGEGGSLHVSWGLSAVGVSWVGLQGCPVLQAACSMWQCSCHCYFGEGCAIVSACSKILLKQKGPNIQASFNMALNMRITLIYY